MDHIKPTPILLTFYMLASFWSILCMNIIAKVFPQRSVSKIFQLRFLKIAKIVWAKYSLNKQKKNRKNPTD